jgi:hypothetical protein
LCAANVEFAQRRSLWLNFWPELPDRPGLLEPLRGQRRPAAPAGIAGAGRMRVVGLRVARPASAGCVLLPGVEDEHDAGVENEHGRGVILLVSVFTAPVSCS